MNVDDEKLKREEKQIASESKKLESKEENEEKQKQIRKDYAHLDEEALQLMLRLDDDETEDNIELSEGCCGCCGACIMSVCGTCINGCLSSCKLCLNMICCGMPCGTIICGILDCTNKTTKKVSNSGFKIEA